MEYETLTFLGCALTCAAIFAMASAAHPGKKAKRRLHQRKSFKTKLKILLFINQLLIPCRMYDHKPPFTVPQCHVCATKGGWSRCLRSKVIMLRRNIKEHNNHPRRPQ